MKDTITTQILAEKLQKTLLWNESTHKKPESLWEMIYLQIRNHPGHDMFIAFYNEHNTVHIWIIFSMEFCEHEFLYHSH